MRTEKKEVVYYIRMQREGSPIALKTTSLITELQEARRLMEGYRIYRNNYEIGIVEQTITTTTEERVVE